jgi:hypothetical protein
LDQPAKRARWRGSSVDEQSESVEQLNRQRWCILHAQFVDSSRRSSVAIGVYFVPASLTAQQYDSAIDRLEAAGAGKPAGRSYHTCFGEPNKLAVFEVWDSMASFERFGPTLMPILQEIGIDPGQPQVMSIHNIISA